MSQAVTSGMVLAAGLGTRMRPLTLTMPKPLIKVAGRTMADRCLDRLIEAGVDTCVLNTSYLGDQIQGHFKNRMDLNIIFSPEAEPLETGGGVTKALPHLLGDAFYVLNGDAVLVNGSRPALTNLQKHWNPDEMDALLLLHPREAAIGFDGTGDFFLDDQDRPSFRGEAESAPYVFTGVQILAKQAFAHKTVTKWSLRDIYMDAITDGRIKAVIHEGDWLHVGTPDGLTLAEEYFAKNS